MATYDLKPKDVVRTLDVKFLLTKKKEKEKDHDKHKEGPEKSVPEPDQNRSGKETK